MTKSELDAILVAHAAWLCGTPNGKRANLSGANLSGANLSGANLSHANLSHANLSHADLSGADLSGADLSGADLSDANLRGANLRGANLSYADLSRAYLIGAYLIGVNLSDADLRGAYLSGANLSGANLSGAALRGANLRDADLPFGPVTLPDGAFRAYKLACGPNGERVIVTLEIPEDAQRVAPLVGRKCRASSARVLALSSGESAKSWHRGSYHVSVTYRVGEVVTPDSYDPSPFVECSHGIHFFISRKEAEEY
jgi:hypothetical protein